MTFEVRLQLDIRSQWHIGTGRGSGPDLDAEVFRTPGGLPCVPGRTLKGLLREAVETAERAGVYGPDAGHRRSIEWFGSRLPQDGNAPRETQHQAPEHRYQSTEGALRIDSAVLGESDAEAAKWEIWAEHNPRDRNALFRSFASTRIDDEGVASDKTLRAIETVVPLTLYARISSVADGWRADLERALVFLDAVGSHRTRGFGRCTATLIQSAPAATPATIPDTSVAPPITRTLRCAFTLLTDVAVTARAATSGGHRALGCLPGASILGATAAALYRADEAWTKEHDWTLFFSGRVRFHDATLEGAAPAPLAIHSPKDHLYELRGAYLPAMNRAREDIAPGLRVKQERGRWITPTGRFVQPRRRRSMRTAIGEGGRARDGYLYELEALERGQVFYGDIEIDTGDETNDNVIARRIRSLIDGAELRMGRSHNQEFGRVRCAIVDQPRRAFSVRPAPVSQDELVFWCVSAAALLDERGQPTLTPTPAAFGLPDGWRWDAERSFIRVASWAPFRNRRSTESPSAQDFKQRPGSERTVLDAGSTLTFVRGDGAIADLAAIRTQLRRGLGAYTAEGLGRILVEPTFLDGSFPAAPQPGPNEEPPLVAIPVGDLATWITAEVRSRRVEHRALRFAATWLRDVPRDAVAAAQWGALRAELRRLGPSTELPAKIADYLAPARADAQPERADGTRRSAGGGGQRRRIWERVCVENKPMSEWIRTRLTADAAADSEIRWRAMLLLTEWAVRRQRRQGRNEGDRP